MVAFFFFHLLSSASALIMTGCRPSSPSSIIPTMKVSAADEQRLLMSDVALNAFISAEMRAWCHVKLAALDEDESLADTMRRDEIVGGDEAVDLICASTEHAFTMMHKAKDANDVLSNLGSAISYLRQFFRTEELYDPLERVGVTDYDVAHHMTDMYMARRDVGVGFARILQPSGAGMIAARAAVGLPPDDDDSLDDEEEDECVLWSPTNPGVCLGWKSEVDVAFAQRRFERVQMEGTRDPRRGGSGTSR